MGIWRNEPKQGVTTGDGAEGVTIRYTKRSRMLTISGHYDSSVGIEPVQIPLWEFLRALGISEKDLVRAVYGDTP